MTEQLNNEHYYFDVLPLHPQPKPLQTFTSYLIQLANLNGLSYQSSMARLFFPGHNLGFVRNLNDIPPSTFGKLTEITLCTETRLLSSTFYHLVKKFSRNILPGTVTIFLAGSLASHLRFCPLCIDQYSYYFLTWRFKSLIGCEEHSCRLFERCEYCRQLIPLLGNPITKNICPSCKKELKSFSPQPMTKKERIATTSKHRDLTFLLSPHHIEASASQVIELVGKRLRQVRLNRQQSISQVTKKLQAQSGELYFAEDGRIRNGTASFRTYIEYVDYLDLTLFDLFNEALSCMVDYSTAENPKEV